MKKLSPRERVLLLLLAIIVAASGYIFFFYIPTVKRLEEINAQISQSQELSNQQQMQKELQRLSVQVSWEPYTLVYDNL